MSNLVALSSELRTLLTRIHFGEIEQAASKCESPLESAVFWGICCRTLAPRAETLATNALPGAVDDDALGVSLERRTDRWISVWPQLDVKAASGDIYRLDFAMWFRSGNRIAVIDVELDGHDYHERTKEQAERDKRRDRDLQALGWKVARFTGSQVLRDMLGTLDELFTFAGDVAAEG